MSTQRRIIQLFLILSLGLLGSCGYFSDEPVENADVAFVPNVLESGCDFSEDAEQIKHIFEENIASSLDCLRSGLRTYVEVSKRANPNFITLPELNKFINDNLSPTSTHLQDKLGMFFNVGNILLNEPKDSLSVRNLDSMFELLKVFNVEAIHISNAIKSANEKRGDNFLKYSREFSLSLIRLVEYMKPVVSQNLQKGEPGHIIDLKELILDITEAGTLGDFEVDTETLDTLLSFKTLFIGGEKNQLGSDGMLRFLEIAPELVTSVFNLYYSNEDDLGGQTNYLVYFQKNLNEIAGKMHPHADRTVIINQSEIDQFFEKYFDDMEGVEFLKPTIKELKYKVIDGKNNYSDIYTFKNIKSLFSLADIGLDAYLYYLNNETFFQGTQLIRPGFTVNGNLSKQDFVNSTTNLAETLRLKLNRDKIFPAQVEYFEFFKFLNREMEDIDIDEKFLDSAVGFKTMFLGGDKEITNKDELIILFDKMGFLGNIYYDFSSLNLETISARELLELALGDVREFRDNIELSSAFLPVISADEIICIIEYLADDGKSYKDFEPLIQNLKFNLIKGYKDRFTVRDFVSLADLVEGLVEKLYFAEVTFDLISPSRRNQKNVSINESELVDPAYLKIPVEKQVAYLDEFNKILNSYRYYRDENGYSYYGNTIKRYATGLREIVMVKWAADLLLPFYGEFREVKNDKDEIVRQEWVLTLDRLDSVLNEFKPALEYFALWSDSIDTFGRNILLLADLFQEQSDGTLEINAIEIAEYGSLVFMAVKTGDEILSTMVDKGYCSNMGTPDSYIVANDCYRRYFFKTIMVDLGLKNYLTKLYDYVVGTEFEEVINFLKSVEGFARDTDDGLTNLRTAKLIFGAMLNIESTLIRFDKNQDNVLDFSECEDGLSIYYGAVSDLSGLGGGAFEYLVPKAYYYMIDKMSLPPEGIAGFAVLNTYFLPKGIRAKRLNVGKLLEGIIRKANEDLEKEKSAN